MVQTNDVTDRAQDLASALQKSDIYQEYWDAWEALKADGILLARLKDFKKNIWRASSDHFEEEKRLGSIYAELTLSDKARIFLEKEARLCELLRQTMEIVNSAAPYIFDES
ncbi:MAG: YlbF family regulator [Clostridiales bacterium]|jgi:cell fate (sporulation/competence/biofilm development) regulator YlbF (YheA/YmcA/DUF963 family)|nr:YlbF family regulator [Clostridiales bacterium]